MGTIQILRWLLNSVEIVSVIAGFLCWSKLKGTYWKWFPFYLLFIAAAELTGKYFSLMGWKELNLGLFNYLVIPVEFLFFYWLFYQSFKKSNYNWLPFFSTVVYLVCLLFDYLFLSKKQLWFLSFSYTIGNLLLLVLIFRFYYKMVTTDAILSFKENRLFWVSSGLLLFYLGSFPYYGLLNTMSHNYPALCTTYRYVVIVLNILMYLMFTFSFIWGKPNTKYSSS